MVLAASGNPVIAYRGTSATGTGAGLFVVQCDDAQCENETPNEVVTKPGFVGTLDLELDASGNAVVVYMEPMSLLSGSVQLLRCDDPACAGVETPITVDATGNPNLDVHVELDSSDNPTIAYNLGTDELRLIDCDDPICAGDTSTLIDGTDSGPFDFVLDSSDNPVIAWTDRSIDGVQFVHCDDTACVGETPSTVGTGSFKTVYGLELTSTGNPVILTSNDITICGNANCGSSSEISHGGFHLYASLALDASDVPAVSMYDVTSTDLEFFRCADAACSTSTRNKVAQSQFSARGEFNSLGLNSAGSPIIAHFDRSNGDLVLAQCDDLACTPDTTSPTPTIRLAPGQQTTTAAGPVVFSVTFDEDVTGFDASDLFVFGSSGASNGAVEGSGAAYTVTISQIPMEGSVLLTIAAGAAQDAALNDSLEAVNEANRVEFIDATPPTVTVPVSDVTVNAAGGDDSAVVTFETTAVDDAGTALAVTCTPASGTTFDIGTTAVSCSATDSNNLTTTETFTVTVLAAGEENPDTTVAPATPDQDTPTTVPGTPPTPITELPATGGSTSGIALALALLAAGMAFVGISRRRTL